MEWKQRTDRDDRGAQVAVKNGGDAQAANGFGIQRVSIKVDKVLKNESDDDDDVLMDDKQYPELDDLTLTSFDINI